MHGITFMTMSYGLTGASFVDPGNNDTDTSTEYLRACKEMDITPDTNILLCLRAKSTKLDLSGKGLSGKDFAALCTALKDDGTVTTLLLANNDLGDEEAAMLARLLEQNDTLQELDLMSNPIYYNGACEILGTLRGRAGRFTLCLSIIQDTVKVQRCAQQLKEYRQQNRLPEHSIILIMY